MRNDDAIESSYALDPLSQSAIDNALYEYQDAHLEVEVAAKSEDALKKKKGACEPLRDHIRSARKPRMRTVEQFLCDQCDVQIVNPVDGFVVHGNIYNANTSHNGGLVGNNIPDDEKFSIGDIKKTVLCLNCFLKSLNILNIGKSQSDENLSAMYLASKKAEDRAKVSSGIDEGNVVHSRPRRRRMV